MPAQLLGASSGRRSTTGLPHASHVLGAVEREAMPPGQVGAAIEAVGPT
jgi:hypothetical protein